MMTVPSTFQWLYPIYYILNPPTFTTNSTNFPPLLGDKKILKLPAYPNLCFQAQEIGGDDDLPTTEAFHSVGAEDLGGGQETKGDLVVDEVEQVAQPELSWFDAAILGHLELKFEVWFFFFFFLVVELSRSGRWEAIFVGGVPLYLFLVLLQFFGF